MRERGRRALVNRESMKNCGVERETLSCLTSIARTNGGVVHLPGSRSSERFKMLSYRARTLPGTCFMPEQPEERPTVFHALLFLTLLPANVGGEFPAFAFCVKQELAIGA